MILPDAPLDLSQPLVGVKSVLFPRGLNQLSTPSEPLLFPLNFADAMQALYKELGVR